jgi:hypothetical protein
MINSNSIELISNLMDLEFYRTTRYKIPTSIVLFKTKCNGMFEDVVSDNLRKTDLCHYLDKDTFAVIFTHSNKEESKLAIKKLILMMKEKCEQPIYTGYSQVLKKDDGSTDSIKRASKALSEATKDNYIIFK